MRCKSCSTNISTEYTYAVQSNLCPRCGQDILPPEQHGQYIFLMNDLKRLLQVTGDPRVNDEIVARVLTILVDNYRLQRKNVAAAQLPQPPLAVAQYPQPQFTQPPMMPQMPYPQVPAQGRYNAQQMPAMMSPPLEGDEQNPLGPPDTYDRMMIAAMQETNQYQTQANEFIPGTNIRRPPIPAISVRDGEVIHGVSPYAAGSQYGGAPQPGYYGNPAPRFNGGGGGSPNMISRDGESVGRPEEAVRASMASRAARSKII